MKSDIYKGDNYAYLILWVSDIDNREEEQKQGYRIYSESRLLELISSQYSSDDSTYNETIKGIFRGMKMHDVLFEPDYSDKICKSIFSKYIPINDAYDVFINKDKSYKEFFYNNFWGISLWDEENDEWYNAASIEKVPIDFFHSSPSSINKDNFWDVTNIEDYFNKYKKGGNVMKDDSEYKGRSYAYIVLWDNEAFGSYRGGYIVYSESRLLDEIQMCSVECDKKNLNEAEYVRKWKGILRDMKMHDVIYDSSFRLTQNDFSNYIPISNYNIEFFNNIISIEKVPIDFFHSSPSSVNKDNFWDITNIEDYFNKYKNGGEVDKGKEVYWWMPFHAYEKDGKIGIYFIHNKTSEFISYVENLKEAKFIIDNMQEGYGMGIDYLKNSSVEWNNGYYYLKVGHTLQRLSKSKRYAEDKFELFKKGAEYNKYKNGGKLSSIDFWDSWYEVIDKNNVNEEYLRDKKRVAYTQKEYDRTVFLEIENGEVVGINFFQGIYENDGYLRNDLGNIEPFMFGDERINQIFLNIEDLHSDKPLIRQIDLTIHLYIWAFIFPPNLKESEYKYGGEIEISKEQLENMVGRKLNGWNDDKVEYKGVLYQKCFLKSAYKLA